MNVDGIEVSSFCSECALFEYVIKREYVFTDKGLILTRAVTNYPSANLVMFRNDRGKKHRTFQNHCSIYWMIII